jgi:hypothetical protein
VTDELVVKKLLALHIFTKVFSDLRLFADKGSAYEKLVESMLQKQQYTPEFSIVFI